MRSALATEPTGGCLGLDKTTCVLRNGCLLDQRAVRHADILGHDVNSGRGDANSLLLIDVARPSTPE